MLSDHFHPYCATVRLYLDDVIWFSRRLWSAILPFVVQECRLYLALDPSLTKSSILLPGFWTTAARLANQVPGPIDSASGEYPVPRQNNESVSQDLATSQQASHI